MKKYTHKVILLATGEQQGWWDSVSTDMLRLSGELWCRKASKQLILSCGYALKTINVNLENK